MGTSISIEDYKEQLAKILEPYNIAPILLDKDGVKTLTGQVCWKSNGSHFNSSITIIQIGGEFESYFEAESGSSEGYMNQTPEDVIRWLKRQLALYDNEIRQKN